MTAPLEQKSTADQIRRRFDAGVDRFSNLDTGQEATMDAPLMMALTAKAALGACPPCDAHPGYRLRRRQRYAKAPAIQNRYAL